LVVGSGQRGRRGLKLAGDGGDQGDQLVLAVPVGNLVLDDADVPGLCGVQVLGYIGFWRVDFRSNDLRAAVSYKSPSA
jgi:hypothetical protein